MSIPSFKKELLSNQKKYFSQYRFTYIEKRTIIIEMRINISQDSFIEIYYNSMTDKKCYTLIKNRKRIFGYDNYKHWHFHPVENPDNHIPCKEPSIEEVFLKIKDILISGS